MIKKRLPNQQAGFTMIEVLVSLAIFSLIATSMTSAFINMMRANTTSERSSAAVHAAQRVLDRLRLTDPNDMPASGNGTAQTISVGEYDFSVVVTYCPETTYCVSDNIRHLRATVSLAGEAIYSVDTVYAQLQ